MSQVVVITGAGGGLGSMFAKALAKSGKKVAVLDFNLENAEKVAEEIRADGGTAIAVKCDVSDKSSMEAARAQVREELGKCDALINCAGIQEPLAMTTTEKYAPGQELDTEVAELPENPEDPRAARAALVQKERSLFNLDAKQLQRVMNVNWLGTFVACQVFSVDMIGREGCSIVNIGSVATFEALSKVPAYASSKAAVGMLTLWLASYLSGTGVRVNAVAPGYFLTPLNHDMYVNPDGSYTQRYDNVLHRLPAGRLGETKELVGAIEFLIDPKAAGYVNGVVLKVDGGFGACPGI